MREVTCSHTPTNHRTNRGLASGQWTRLRLRNALSVLACLVAGVIALAACPARAADELKLDYLPRDAVFGLVLQPERTMKLPELQVLPWEVFTSTVVRSMGIDPAQVKLAVGVIGLEGWTINEPSMGAVFYFSQPIPAGEVFTQLGLNNNGVKFEGVTYYRNRSGQRQSITAAFPDERTLVFASNETYLKKMLSAKPDATGIHRLLKRVDLSRDVSAVVDFEKLAPLIVLGLQAYPDLPPVLDEFLTLPELVTSVEMSVKVRTDVDLQLTLGARDANGAAELKKLADHAKAHAREYVEKQIVPSLDTGAPSEIGPAMAKYARRITTTMLDRIEVTERDKELSIHAKLPFDVVSTGIGLAMMTGMAAPAARPVAAAAAAEAPPPAPGGVVLQVRPAVVNRADAGDRKSLNNMKQIGLALHNYHDRFNRFPAPASLGKDDKKLLSWRVAILPYIDQQELYDQFHLDEPWDSDHNKKLIEKMPDVFRSPGQKGDKGTTVYLAADGKQSVFEGPKPIGLRSIIDGSSNTIIVVEADDDRAVIWTKPEDLKYDVEKPLTGLGKMTPKGFLALMCDGSVQRIPLDTSLDDIRALFTKDGRETVNLNR